MNIRIHITLFQRRFLYIHTYFCSKIMCGCQLVTCLYDIRQTSCERRLHHSHVAPSMSISAKFTFTLGKICSRSIRTAMLVLSRTGAIVYRHILLGENSFDLIHTRAHEKNLGQFFPRRASIYTVYCWENVKNCKVTYTRGFFASIYYFT